MRTVTCISDCAVQMLLSPFIGPLKCHYLHFVLFLMSLLTAAIFHDILDRDLWFLWSIRSSESPWCPSWRKVSQLVKYLRISHHIILLLIHHIRFWHCELCQHKHQSLINSPVLQMFYIFLNSKAQFIVLTLYYLNFHVIVNPSPSNTNVRSASLFSHTY